MNNIMTIYGMYTNMIFFEMIFTKISSPFDAQINFVQNQYDMLNWHCFDFQVKRFKVIKSYITMQWNLKKLLYKTVLLFLKW